MFAWSQGPELVECAICGEKVDIFDKITVDRETIHKKCFTCCYCGKGLQQGACAMALAFFNRIGPRFYCSGKAGSCAMLPNDQKEAKLKEKGLATRKTTAKSNFK
ncbi:hypothetical protein niasHS_015810 [Heterodera schachtii]|uniref:LIM zinc-binding domain-containing protein n=2 Tax=Heterodera TaxID=34509 RepID=A0ABD2HWY8_HETSC